MSGCRIEPADVEAMLRVFQIASDGAAPHPPAGTFTPYRDGEKCNFIYTFANLGRCRNSAVVAASTLLPVLTGRRSRQGDEGQRQRPIHTLLIMITLGVFILHHRINMGIISVWLGGRAVCRGWFIDANPPVAKPARG